MIEASTRETLFPSLDRKSSDVEALIRFNPITEIFTTKKNGRHKDLPDIISLTVNFSRSALGNQILGRRPVLDARILSAVLGIYSRCYAMLKIPRPRGQ
jgi:hypothetical protein